MNGRAMAPEQGPGLSRELRVPHGSIALEWPAGRCVVRFTGDIDIAFSREGFARLAAAVRAGGLPLDVDCSGVTYIGAEGIRMLVLLRSAAVDHRFGAVATSAALDRLRRAYPLDCLLLAG